jgi:predicted RND superfamily exporter protein
MAHLSNSPPDFNTDLADFAPDSEANDAHERIHQHFPNETRPLFVEVKSDDGSNILSIDNIRLMDAHLSIIKNASQNRSDMISVWTTAPGIVQLSLDEKANGTLLGDVDSWEEMLDLIFDANTTCTMTSDDQLLSAATYASSALLNKDLSIDSTCSYLKTGNGSAAPSATTTLWVLEVDPNMDEKTRKVLQDQMRDEFATLSADSSLHYGVVSLDLISYDIDEGTFENLTLLVVLALLVVVILLSIAFRSVPDVLFPLVGLSSALIWTYGVMNLLGAQFTALEVAVAPLVLGLGIDYAIHLQRAYAAIRKEHEDPAEAWLRSCARLSVPLLLAVVTTVAAFLANAISPLPPLATFGYALAFGVVCAFVSATVIVGSLHVVVRTVAKKQEAKAITMPKLVDGIVAMQQKQQVAVLLVTILISAASMFGAASLETDFDLGDFVDQEMEIMTVRDDLNTNYDSAGWKLVYILLEPVEGESTIPGDALLLEQVQGLHADLTSNHDVVGTDERIPSPAYEGPYVVLRDAILRNASFGEAHNLEVFDGDVYVIDSELGVNLGMAFKTLANNHSVADAISGETWSERVSQTVALDDAGILFLRNEVRVEASTSTQAERVISQIEQELGSPNERGTLRENLVDHADLHVTGDLVILQTVLDGLSVSQVKTTLISLVVSSVVLLLLTRRILPAVVVLFPVALASLWVAGSMVALGLKWNVLTVMVTALTLGIGIDYSIHMWRRFEVELERRSSHWEALRAALSTTGVALIMSALTTGFGILVLLFSPMPVIQDFGLITAVTVFFSLLLSLILLPVLVELSARNKEQVVEVSDGTIIEG